ncbi:MAG TPA: hydroxysqualene dehydroxylase HpnE [Micropepsaceae bacterium]|nr:hydroxysqualene dehydroxylase HpnE [Micropepsaceae bacterium]
MKTGTVHIAGAGLAGLSAAVTLAARGARVEVIEAAPAAGGRCRSYYEPALERVIDNGNHLVLSGNRAVQDYVRMIGSGTCFAGPRQAEFAFADLRTNERWLLRPNAGTVPWWIFSKSRRVPGTRATDYLAFAKLMRARGETLGDALPAKGVLSDRLLLPLLVAALNTRPEIAAAKLAAAIVRETLAKGGSACIPRIASPTLAAAFVDPAIAFVKARGGSFRFGQRLRNIAFAASGAQTLELADSALPVSHNDRVIVAVPPWVAKPLLPGIDAPDEFRAIVSGHFGVAPPADAAPIMGVVGGTVEWIFAFPDRISVTISDADRFNETDRAELAALCWRDVARIFRLPPDLPPWQIVKEKRATFAATPEQERKRPGAVTPWPNLFLAGDWTDTGLPATIEGAVRSGQRAAQLVLAGMAV